MKRFIMLCMIYMSAAVAVVAAEPENYVVKLTLEDAIRQARTQSVDAAVAINNLSVTPFISPYIFLSISVNLPESPSAGVAINEKFN